MFLIFRFRECVHNARVTEVSEVKIFMGPSPQLYNEVCFLPGESYHVALISEIHAGDHSRTFLLYCISFFTNLCRT